MRPRSALRPAQLRVIQELKQSLGVQVVRDMLDESGNTPKLYGYPCSFYWTFLTYDAATGLFAWKEREASKTFNTRFAGKPAFTTIDSKGYLMATLFYQTTWAHRVAYFMHHNHEIPHEIDHINGVRTDNRVINLRAVTVAENRKNAARRSDNTSGITGVSWMKTKQRWRARYHDAEGRETHIGLFHSRNAAERALRDCRALHGYHDNHGRGPNAKTQ